MSSPSISDKCVLSGTCSVRTELEKASARAWRRGWCGAKHPVMKARVDEVGWHHARTINWPASRLRVLCSTVIASHARTAT
jgi:hypothetical protein